MKQTEQFLIDQNVRNYIDVLAWEVDPRGRRIYSELLRLEEDRFAKEAVQLDVIEGWIKKCARHIGQFRTLMGKSGVMEMESHPDCQALIQGMLETKSILISLRQAVLGSVDVADALLAKKCFERG